MQEIERIILTILGIVITLENLIVVIATIRNKSLQDNIYYNLVISLSVCDSVLGLNVLTFGNLVMPNTNSNDKKHPFTLHCCDYFDLCNLSYVIGAYFLHQFESLPSDHRK